MTEEYCYRLLIIAWQCYGAGAALFGRSREKRAGSSSTAQAPAMAPCLKKRYNKNVN